MKPPHRQHRGFTMACCHPEESYCAARKRHGKKIKAKFNGTFQESVGEFDVTAREFDVTAPSRTNANFG
jgi:hypothetical protein